jgi:hypothetical protein
MRCDFRASLLACTLASPCLDHKPKARVATQMTRIHDFKEKEKERGEGKSLTQWPMEGFNA